jgi:putative transposase
MKYQRAYTPGGTFFFTVVTHQRSPVFISEERVELLREAFRYVLVNHPFEIVACVVLPDHIHRIWALPEGDNNYSTRWRLIKSFYSRNLDLPTGDISLSRKMKGELAIWQRRFWEHQIRDENDLNNHLEYIHYNPVKHGLVNAPVEWKYSSFHAFVRKGIYTADWGSGEEKGSELYEGME